MSETEAKIADPLIGTKVAGHFELLSRIGSGGMSVVYKARDLLLNRIVAVKVLHARSAFSPKCVMRFRQEAIAALKLDHPNIIRVYEFDIPDNSEPYLVMEYLQGESLAQLIASNGPIEQRWAMSIMSEICAGLQHAHEVGVLHRDLKPSNIMLVKEGNKYKVKLFDFGIAKLLLEDGEQSHDLTQTGDVIGSPLYMSPEQCESKPLDARSDIYSLGCVMYEMLTGKPPMQGSSLLKTLQMHISSLPRSVEDMYPGIRNSEKIDTILLKAMAKQREQRFQTVSEFADAIRTLGDQTDQSIIERLCNQLQLEFLRNKTKAKGKEPTSKFALALACISALTILVAILLVNYLTLREATVDHNRSPGSSSALPSAVEEHRQIADEKPEQMWSRLDAQAQTAVDNGDYDSARKAYEQSHRIAVSLKPQYQFQLASAEGLSDLCALTRQSTSHFDFEISKLTPQVLNWQSYINLLHQDSNQEDTSKLLDQSIDMGDQLNRWGKFAEARSILATALSVADSKLAADDPLRGRCLLSLAECYLTSGTSSQRGPLYLLKAYEILSKHPATALFVKCARTLGQYYMVINKPAVAETYLEQARNSAKEVSGVNSKQTANCDYELSVCYQDLKKDMLATATAHEALNILHRLKQEDFDAQTFKLQAQLEEGFRHYRDAATLYNKSLAEYEKVPQKDYQNLSVCCRLFAQCLNRIKMRSKAESLLMRELVIRNRIGDLPASEECIVSNELASMYLADGNTAKQKEASERAVVSILRWPRGNRVRNAESYCAKELAYINLAEGDLKSAEKNAQIYRSLIAEESNKGYDSSDLDCLLGIIYVDTNRTEEGKELLLRALKFFTSTTPSTDGSRQEYLVSIRRINEKLAELKAREAKAGP